MFDLLDLLPSSSTQRRLIFLIELIKEGNISASTALSPVISLYWLIPQQIDLLLNILGTTLIQASHLFLPGPLSYRIRLWPRISGGKWHPSFIYLAYDNHVTSRISKPHTLSHCEENSLSRLQNPKPILKNTPIGLNRNSSVPVFSKNSCQEKLVRG